MNKYKKIRVDRQVKTEHLIAHSDHNAVVRKNWKWLIRSRAQKKLISIFTESILKGAANGKQSHNPIIFTLTPEFCLIPCCVRIPRRINPAKLSTFYKS